MIKTLAAAALLSLGLGGYALAQSTVTGGSCRDCAGDRRTDDLGLFIIMFITTIIIITCTMRWCPPQLPPPRSKRRRDAKSRTRKLGMPVGRFCGWGASFLRPGRAERCQRLLVRRWPARLVCAVSLTVLFRLRQCSCPLSWSSLQAVLKAAIRN